jgi:phosphoserine phosphatase
MSYVATLISAPEARAVDDRLVREVVDFLPSAQISVWLQPQTAIDIAFQFDDLSDLNLAPAGETAFLAGLAGGVRELMQGQPVDVVIQPDDDNRRKMLFVADMDSTMIGQECIDELADMIGLKDRVAAITERAMRGEIAFEPALRERVALLKGLSVGVIDDVLRERIRANPGARALLATMRAHGTHSCLVSGGFTHFVEHVARELGFDETRANALQLDVQGNLTGLVDEPILGREAKLAALVGLREQRHLKRAQTMAVGDGANDLAMLQEAGLGVAYRAKPKVAAGAHARIDHADLTALLYAQGYRRDEFVEV